MQVGAGAVDEPRPDVAAEVVRSEPVRARRPLQRMQQVLVGRVVLRDQRSGERRQHDHPEDRQARDEARRAVPAVAEAAPVLDDRRLDEQFGFGVGDRAHSNRTRGSSSACATSVSR